MIKAVVFDLDDTLISEYDYIQSAYRVTAKKIIDDYNLAVSHEDVYDIHLKMFHESAKNVFNRILDFYNLPYDKSYISSLITTYREHMPYIRFYDDVRTSIRQLKERRIKTGIITDGYKETQKIKLNALNAYELFDYIIVTDELGRQFWKPSTKPIELMAQKLNVDFNEMIYIGDNPNKDFFVGSIYPITTIRISRKNGIYNNAIYLEGIKEKYHISSLNEVIKYLR